MPPAEDHILQILHDNWGYDQFRGIQRDIIDSILAKHDTLGLMPTGGGKSITFQLPALMAGSAGEKEGEERYASILALAFLSFRKM